MSSLVNAIGRLFIVGYPGAEPPDEFLEFVNTAKLGGVIFFADNCPSPSQLQDSIRTIKSCYGERSPFMAIDQEGGRVTRLKGAPAEFRAAAEYGKDDSIEAFIEDYTRSAVFLESLGINLNLAPVADIGINPNNSCLKDRCFGSEAGKVAVFVKAAVKVARRSGLLSCLKHFPGLGAATNDPHQLTAVADYTAYEWKKRESIPFREGVVAGVDMIMTTHLSLPRIDRTIVTSSQRIISELLRGELGFDGPVITDDLTMKGAATLGSIGRRTVAAFNAGHDILLFGQDYRTARRAYEYFVDAFLRQDILEEKITAALDRVSGTQCKLNGSVLR